MWSARRGVGARTSPRCRRSTPDTSGASLRRLAIYAPQPRSLTHAPIVGRSKLPGDPLPVLIAESVQVPAQELGKIDSNRIPIRPIIERQGNQHTATFGLRRREDKKFLVTEKLPDHYVIGSVGTWTLGSFLDRPLRGSRGREQCKTPLAVVDVFEQSGLAAGRPHLHQLCRQLTSRPRQSDLRFGRRLVEGARQPERIVIQPIAGIGIGTEGIQRLGNVSQYNSSTTD